MQAPVRPGQPVHAPIAAAASTGRGSLFAEYGAPLPGYPGSPRGGAPLPERAMLVAMLRCLLVQVLACVCLGAADIGGLPLIFREDWTESPPALPLTQKDVANSSLKVTVHGPGPPLIKKSYHDARDWDPHYVWSGLSSTPWAVSLELADSGLMDLSGRATVRWRTRQSGFHTLRVVVQLANGSWLVSDWSDPASDHWHVNEVVLSGTRWRQLDMGRIAEGPWESRPDLANVRSVGFTDLMPGGRSGACSRLDWIEVYGQRVPSGPIQVFILSGQSNMVGWGNSVELESVDRFGHDRRRLMFEEGAWRPLKPSGNPSRRQREQWGLVESTFGPEIGFVRSMVEAWPGRRIGIVKQAVGGTGIMAWAPEWNRGDADITGDAAKGPLYRALVAKARAAMAADSTELRAFLWLQGAKDMRTLEAAGRYEENLQILAQSLRRDLGMPGLPVLVGSYRQGDLPDELPAAVPVDAELQLRRPGAWPVLRAQSRVGERIPPAATVILRDLPRHPGNIHANTEGMLQAGREYARVFLERFDQSD